MFTNEKANFRLLGNLQQLTGCLCHRQQGRSLSDQSTGTAPVGQVCGYVCTCVDTRVRVRSKSLQCSNLELKNAFNTQNWLSIDPCLVLVFQCDGFEVLQFPQIPQFHYRVISRSGKVIPWEGEERGGEGEGRGGRGEAGREGERERKLVKCEYRAMRVRQGREGRLACTYTTHPFSEKETEVIAPEWPGKLATFALSFRSQIFTTLVHAQAHKRNVYQLFNAHSINLCRVSA